MIFEDEFMDKQSEIIALYKDAVEEKILPELEEICEKHNKPIPQEFRYIYSVKSGAFDADYRYEKDINEIEEYEPGIAAQEWMELVFKA